MTLALGIDPSLTKLGWAVVHEHHGRVADVHGRVTKRRHLEVIDAGVVRAKANSAGLGMIVSLASWTIPHFDLACVEQMQIRKFGTERGASDGQDLLNLNLVSGACLYRLLTERSDALVITRRPAEWKGTIEKEAHHPQLCTKVGWGYVAGKCPTGAEAWGWDTKTKTGKIKDAEWKEVLDAIGMAIYCLDKAPLLKIECEIRIL